jgi:hypothetical protein
VVACQREGGKNVRGRKTMQKRKKERTKSLWHSSDCTPICTVNKAILRYEVCSVSKALSRHEACSVNKALARYGVCSVDYTPIRTKTLGIAVTFPLSSLSRFSYAKLGIAVTLPLSSSLSRFSYAKLGIAVTLPLSHHH